MSRRLFAVVAVVTILLLNPALSIKFESSDEDLVVSAQRRKYHHDSHHTTKEWIEAPNGFLYQFHSGDQSWLSAREFCLSQNSDLVTLRDNEQIDWLLHHYAPTYPRFTERYIQVGLILPDGPNRDWTYVDGSKYNQSLISWISGEPFDHSVDGKERCALLRVHARLLDDVDCEMASRSRVRFICERNHEKHKQQQRSGNYLWKKVEELMKYFRFWTDNAVSGSDEARNSWRKGNDVENENLNLTSIERDLLQKVNNGNNTSAEEEQVVEAVLEKLGKPGTTSQRRGSAERSELFKTTQHDQQQLGADTPTEEEATPPTVTKSTTEEVSVEAEEAPVTDNTIVTDADGTGSEPSEESVKEKARAAPLREIVAEEGSGVETQRSEFEESGKLHHEIEPEKLRQIISTMEKMIERLENITIAGEKKERKNEPLLGESSSVDTAGLKKEVVRSGEKVKSNDSPFKIPQTAKADTETLNEMENDFDDNLNKDLPTTDIRPQTDDDCEEGEGSGESFTPETPSESVLRNVIDAEDVDSLSQKPKISADREEHVHEFLHTLRTFLARAEHNDLRKILHDNRGKTLLEKMKLAIAVANQREFNRMKELELMKRNGIDVSNVPEPDRMSDTVREELFRKIRGVVIAEAEKFDVDSAREPSHRTTTQETRRKVAAEKHQKQTKSAEARSSEKYNSHEEIPEKESEERPNTENRENTGMKQHEEEKDEQLREVKEKPVKISAKQELMKDHKRVKGESELEKKKRSSEKTEENQSKTKDVEVTSSNVDQVVPERTKQLKEFEEKEDIMSKESQMPLEKVTRKTTKSPVSVHKQKKGGESSVEVHMEPLKQTTNSKPTNNENEVEVGTQSTTVDKTTTKDSAEQEAEEDDEEKERSTTDATNPLGLPTLPPTATLAPLPSLKTLFDNLAKHWQQLFKLPKPANTAQT